MLFGDWDYEKSLRPIVLSIVRSAGEHDQSRIEGRALEGRRRGLGASPPQFYGTVPRLWCRDLHADALGRSRLGTDGDQGILVGRRGDQGAQELALGSAAARPARRRDHVVPNAGSYPRTYTCGITIRPSPLSR